MNTYTDGLKRFTESITIDNRLIRELPITDSLQEKISRVSSHLKESVSLSSKAWRVPISQYDIKNFNNRIYSKELWENVMNNQRDLWEGTPMLADHPEDDSDGNPRDICGIWVDMEVNPDGFVYGYLVPSGRLGDDLQDHLRHGLKAGTSSSGFGKLLGDGITVDPDTYVIERLSDWVLNPSQGTYFSFTSDEEEDSSDPKQEEAKEDPQNQEEDHHQESAPKIKNASREINESKEKEEITNPYFESKSPSKISKLEERKFRRDMKEFLESADSIQDPAARLEEFREIKEESAAYFNEGVCLDLKDQVEKKIAEQEKLINSMVKEAQDIKDNFKVKDADELNDKVTDLVNENVIFKEKANNWKQISVSLQKKLDAVTENNKINEKVLHAQMRESLNHSQKIITNTQTVAKQLNETLINTQSQLSETQKKLDEAPTQVYVDLLKEKTAYFTKKLDKAEKDLHRLQRNYDLDIRAKNGKIKGLQECLDTQTRLSESRGKSLEGAAKLAEKTRKLLEVNRIQAKQIASYKEKIETLVSEKDEKINKLVKAVESLKNSLKEKEEELSKTEAQLDDMIDYANDNPMVKSLKNKFSEFTDIKKDEVQSYFDDLAEAYGPEMNHYKSYFKDCHSVNEARNVFIFKVMNKLKENEKLQQFRGNFAN